MGEAPPGPAAFGRYRIVDRIAKGGMAEVYRATAEGIGGVAKVVAIKLVRAEFADDPEFVRMFLEEARVSLQLSHANVVQVFDAGKIDDRYFLAMECVEGTTLAGVLAACRRDLAQPLPERHALFVIVEALKGLDYAHRRRDPAGRPLGIVHRDVSPSNVLLSNEGEVKVADFGIAMSAMRSISTASTTIKGKLGYMAPEQLRGRAVDARADLYSVGAVLYEMLTMQAPFPDATPANIPDILAGRFPRPREVTPHVPAEIESAILRAMETDPEARYATAAQMREALERFAHREGYQLSSADLGEFLGRVRTLVARDSEERFDLLLGQELKKIDSAENFSVFSTTSMPAVNRTRPLAEPAKAPGAPKGPDPDSEVDLPRPGSPRRILAGAAILAIVAGTAAGITAGVRRRGSRATVVVTGSHTTAAAAFDGRTRPAPTPAASSAVAPAGNEDPSAPRLGTPVLAGGRAKDHPTRHLAPSAPPPRRRPAGGSPPQTATSVPPAQTAPPQPPAEPAGARLSINSDPWSRVFVDGHFVHNTPLIGYALAAGAHRVELRSQSDAVLRAMDVTLAVGEHRRMGVDLR